MIFSAIAALFTSCLESVAPLEQWKKAGTTSLHMKGHNHVGASHREITLLPKLDKPFFAVLAQGLVSFADLHDSQICALARRNAIATQHVNDDHGHRCRI